MLRNACTNTTNIKQKNPPVLLSFLSYPGPEELVGDEEDLDGLRLGRPEHVPLAVERLQRLVRQRLVKTVQRADLIRDGDDATVVTWYDTIE